MNPKSLQLTLAENRASKEGSMALDFVARTDLLEQASQPYFNRCMGISDGPYLFAIFAVKLRRKERHKLKSGGKQTEPETSSDLGVNSRCSKLRKDQQPAHRRGGDQRPKIRLSLLIVICHPIPLWSAAVNRPGGQAKGRSSRSPSPICAPSPACWCSGAAPSFLSIPPPPSPSCPPHLHHTSFRHSQSSDALHFSVCIDRCHFYHEILLLLLPSRSPNLPSTSELPTCESIVVNFARSSFSQPQLLTTSLGEPSQTYNH